MGFKITHPLLPSRLLVWPLWHTSTWRLHVPPDRMSGTSNTTKWPHSLHFLVFVIILIFRTVVVLTFPLVSRWRGFFSPHLLPHFKVVFHQWRAIVCVCVFFPPLHCLSASRAPFHFCAAECLLISISVWMSLHLRPPRLSFLRCILFIFFLNWFHSVQAYAFSRLIALVDSCKEIRPGHVKNIELCCMLIR